MGAGARARRVDERRAKEVPADALKRPAIRLATAILMYSFGGLRREGSKEGEILPPGVSEQELLSVCVGPDLDSTTALACLKELKEQCLYLHFDGVRYGFKKDPNVTLLVEQEADALARDEKRVSDRIKEMLEARLAGHRAAIVWPEKPADVPDCDPAFLVAYLPLAFGAEPKTSREEQAKRMFEKYGDKPRNYRNGLGLAVPAADQIEILRRSVRYLMAVENVKAKPKQHNLTDEQKGQLKERGATETAAAESAFVKLYTEVWLPRVEEGAIGIESVAVGGHPLQTTVNEKKQAMIHERVMELLTTTYRKVHGMVKPSKIVELFKMGEGTPPKMGIRATEVVDGLYSFLGFPRLTAVDAIRKGIAEGVSESVFGYVSGAPELGADGKYQVPPPKVRFSTPVAEDEIDLESGFLMMPQAIPQPAAVPGPGPTPPGGGPGAGPGAGPGPTPPGPTPPAPPGPAPERLVEIAFSADRNQLFIAWNAVANLADMAGKVSVMLRAESQEGFDQGKLQNGVLEPLREADLIP